jgi:hypothetical protein
VIFVTVESGAKTRAMGTVRRFGYEMQVVIRDGGIEPSWILVRLVRRIRSN